VAIVGKEVINKSEYGDFLPVPKKKGAFIERMLLMRGGH